MKTILSTLFILAIGISFGQVTEPESEHEQEIAYPPPSPPVREKKYEVISYPGTDAQFPGGVKALMEFINTNIKYPADALKESIQGKVYVSFNVYTNGEIIDVKVIRGLYPSMNAEAIRVVKLMPNWIPGEIDGKPAKTLMRIPIVFSIAKKK